MKPIMKPFIFDKFFWKIMGRCFFSHFFVFSSFVFLSYGLYGLVPYSFGTFEVKADELTYLQEQTSINALFFHEYEVYTKEDRLVMCTPEFNFFYTWFTHIMGIWGPATVYFKTLCLFLFVGECVYLRWVFAYAREVNAEYQVWAKYDYQYNNERARSELF